MLKLWLEDSVHALHALWSTPRFSVPALLSMTLGIGASTAVFALFSALLLRPLRFDDEQRLVAVSVQTASRAGSGIDLFGLSAPFARELGELRSVFASFSAYRLREVTLTEGKEGRLAHAAMVTPEFFDTLQPQVALGRTFHQQGPAPDGADVVVLRRGYWLTALGGAAVVGRSVLIDGEPKTILGVLDDDAAQPVEADLWLPSGFTAYDYDNRFLIPFRGLARLAPGLSLAAAQERLREDAVRRNIHSGDGTLCAAQLEPFRDDIVGEKRGLLTLLGVAAAALFLLACANVAALLVTRATATSHALAVRRALGAGARTLLRHCALEVSIAMVASSLAGMLLAAALLRLANAEWHGLELTPARLDLRVLAALAALALLGGLLIGISPALHSLRVHPMDALRASGRSTSGRGARRWRELLVTLQVGASVALLGGAGVILRSVHNLQQVEPGFDRAAVGLRVLLPPAPSKAAAPAAASPEQTGQLARAVLERAQRIPGVRSAAVAGTMPFSRHVMFGFDVAPPARASKCHALLQLVSPDYFRTLGIGLLSGRAFDEGDIGGAGVDQPGTAVIVNRTFARDIIGTLDAAGHEINMVKLPSGSPWLRIVGVVEDILEEDLTQPVAPVVYTPYTGKFRPHGDSFAVVVRSSAEPEQALSALQGAVRELDASLPVYEADVLGTLTERSYWQTRALGLALSCFALAAVVLAAIGLFGVTSYNVSERFSEIAIRRALGASRGAIARMILRDTLRVVGFGLALGLSGAWVARALLASFVYGVTSADPLTYVGVCLGVSLLAVLAALAGARAATSVDPARTLMRS